MLVDPRHIPEVSKKSLVNHNPCCYGAAFKKVLKNPMHDNTPPPPQFAGWTALHKSVWDAYSKLPGGQIGHIPSPECKIFPDPAVDP